MLIKLALVRAAANLWPAIGLNAFRVLRENYCETNTDLWTLDKCGCLINILSDKYFTFCTFFLRKVFLDLLQHKKERRTWSPGTCRYDPREEETGELVWGSGRGEGTEAGARAQQCSDLKYRGETLTNMNRPRNTGMWLKGLTKEKIQNNLGLLHNVKTYILNIYYLN